MTTTRARPPSVAALLLLVLVLGGAAAPARADWEQALARCAPGASYEACVAGLRAEKVTLRSDENGERYGYQEVWFDLQPPLGGVSIRTYREAGGRIVTVSVTALLGKGAPRGELLRWFSGRVGNTARAARATSGGRWATGCGADGWGVGWVAARSSVPEVELQIDEVTSAAAADSPTKMKPEDALLRRAGNDRVDVCFLLPPGEAGLGYIDAPVIAGAVMAAYLESPHFHGKAHLKSAVRAGAPLPEEVRQAVLDVYSVRPRDEATFFDRLAYQVGDVTGDGRPEYVLQVSDHTTDQGQRSCQNLVLSSDGADGGRPAQVFHFDTCCDPTLAPGGGAIRCGTRDLVRWAGPRRWPSATPWPTRAEAQAADRRGHELLAKKQLAEAEAILCNPVRQGAPTVEHDCGCALVMVKTGRLAQARAMYQAALEMDPTSATAYLGVGTVAELTKDPAAAIAAYRKYLEYSTDDAAKARVRARLGALAP